MIFQYQSPKRTVVIVIGGHADQADQLRFVDNTGGDFDPYTDADDDPDSGTCTEPLDQRLGFWPQPTPD